MIKASIIGATGYTGVELVRLLSCHPQVELAMLTTRSYEGEHIEDLFPSLKGKVEIACSPQDTARVLKESDVVFVALPHGHSVPVVQEAVKQGKKVVDLGADFRFRKAATYEEWYQVKHEAPKLAANAVYGLPELYREQIKNASVVANPGCYPTGSILALAPALRAGLIESNTIIIDAKSGVSGAGRKASLVTHFGEANENVNPYGVASHRHTPEIEQELTALAGEEFTISFTPHLMPMTRGILATCYATLKDEISEEKLRQIYEEFYQGESFVHLLQPGQWPHTKWVYGSNRCLINLTADRRTGRLVVCSAIDNLVKGAAGQAVQNMNLLFGLPETSGLDFNAIYP
jgi:N-acetyl-gamma-glutamyl-phosphate reductase